MRSPSIESQPPQGLSALVHSRPSVPGCLITSPSSESCLIINLHHHHSCLHTRPSLNTPTETHIQHQYSVWIATVCTIQRFSVPIMKGLFALSLWPLLASASPVFVESIHNEAAPVLSSSTSLEIPDSYIVVFKKDVSHASACAHHDWVHGQHLEVEKTKRDLAKRSQLSLSTFSGLKHTYNIAGSLLGYSGHFDEDVIERVRRHPDVSYKTRSLILRTA